jgi:anti-sigma regulatory factor (Ser/Thr protein kinase)
MTAQTQTERSAAKAREHCFASPTLRMQCGVASNGFRPSLDAPRRARHFVAEVLAEHGYAMLIEDAALIASELATNAVVHAGSRFEVAVHFDTGTVTLSVSDSSMELPVAGDPSPRDESGRGLPVVAALAFDWGWAETGAGKTVWAELGR